MQDQLPDHVRRNREAWDIYAEGYADAGHRAWSSEVPYWGIWNIPEEQARILPEVQGLEGIELGCGTGYVSSWLMRRGARMTGIDNSEKQLATARALQDEFQMPFPLIHGNAEQVPLPDASFDLAISEYGASIWCDPYRWIPEASRLLRPGGRLIFLVNGVILMLCAQDDESVPAEPRLLRPYFGMHRFEWGADQAVEFHIGYGDWIRLLRSNDFEIENLIELQAPADATTSYGFVDAAWAHSWPSEEVWVARKRAR